MNFDKIANQIIKTNSLIREGRTPKSSKYSNISVNIDKFGEMINSGDFEVLLKSWAGNPKYGNLTEDELNTILAKSKESLETYQPTSLKDVYDAIYYVADDAYKAKGPRRKTFTDRLTKNISNILIHKEYDLISIGAGVSTSENDMETDMEDDETPRFRSDSAKKYDVEGLSSIESAIYEFIKQSDTPTTKQELEAQFPGNMHIANDLVAKNLVTRDGDSFMQKTSDGMTSILDVDDDDKDYDEDPFDSDIDARDTFKRTFGDTRSDEGEWDEWDRDQVPSWLR